MGLFDALKYGTIGRCAILMFFAYQLLLKEQKAPAPRNDILQIIKTFMFFAVASMAIGLSSQLPIFQSISSHEASPAHLSSGFGPDYFKADWQIKDGHDVTTPQFAFKPRYAYSGTLRGHTEGNDLLLDGVMHARDIGNPTHELGKANFTFRGPINNNEAAGYFTYSRVDVNGFGSAFLRFDSVGNGTMYMIVRVTSPLENENDVAMVILPMRRIQE
jgi:hypothetical protein